MFIWQKLVKWMWRLSCAQFDTGEKKGLILELNTILYVHFIRSCPRRAWQSDPSSGPLYVAATSVEHADVPSRGVTARVLCCMFLVEAMGPRKSRLTHFCRTDTRWVPLIYTGRKYFKDRQRWEQIPVDVRVHFLGRLICSLRNSFEARAPAAGSLRET